MKRYLIPTVALLFLVMASLTYAITTYTAKPGQSQTIDGAVLQNNTATAPAKGFVRSGSKTYTKGTLFTFNTYTGASWFRKADVCVTNSSGAAVPIRYALGNNTATMIAPAGCFGVTFNREYGTVTVSPFSNASTAGTAYYYSHQRE